MSEYIPIILPSILGYGTAMICGVNKDSGAVVPIRPPPIVFSIVWPILYLMLGFSWFYARKNNNVISDLFYSILVFLLSVWILVYSCQKNKKLAIYILLLSVITGIFAYNFSLNFNSKLLIAPLIAWLIFATILSITEVILLK